MEVLRIYRETVLKEGTEKKKIHARKNDLMADDRKGAHYSSGRPTKRERINVAHAPKGEKPNACFSLKHTFFFSPTSTFSPF